MGKVWSWWRREKEIAEGGEFVGHGGERACESRNPTIFIHSNVSCIDDMQMHVVNSFYDRRHANARYE